MYSCLLGLRVKSRVLKKEQISFYLNVLVNGLSRCRLRVAFASCKCDSCAINLKSRCFSSYRPGLKIHAITKVENRVGKL